MGARRRFGVVLVGAVLAVALLAVLVMGAVPEKADAAPRFRTVTKTFNNIQQLAIPIMGEATPYPSKIKAGGLRKGKILDVNLALKNYSHTYPDDVDVLVSHGTVSRTVMSDVGGSTDVTNINLKLDDEASTLIPDNDPLSSGTFLPTNQGANDTFPAPAPAPNPIAALSGFDGKNPNGSWMLWVRDDGDPDQGQFAGGWSITIKAKVRRSR